MVNIGSQLLVLLKRDNHGVQTEWLHLMYPSFVKMK